MEQTYRTIYKLAKWSSPEELIENMQALDNDGFRNDLTRLYKDGEVGWSIFTKTVHRPNYLDAQISLSELYSILNSKEVYEAAKNAPTDDYTTPVTQEIDRQLKERYERLIQR
jgi:hypothetical protein